MFFPLYISMRPNKKVMFDMLEQNLQHQSIKTGEYSVQKACTWRFGVINIILRHFFSTKSKIFANTVAIGRYLEP